MFRRRDSKANAEHDYDAGANDRVTCWGQDGRQVRKEEGYAGSHNCHHTHSDVCWILPKLLGLCCTQAYHLHCCTLCLDLFSFIDLGDNWLGQTVFNLFQKRGILKYKYLF